MTQKSNEDLDFEIEFYEELIQKYPHFADVLVALGESYTKKGRYEDGLKVDLELSRLRPDDPVVFYNLACSYSLLKKSDEALDALAKALKKGYSEFSFMNDDPDLAFIRSDRRYKKLLADTLTRLKEDDPDKAKAEK